MGILEYLLLLLVLLALQGVIRQIRKLLKDFRHKKK